MKSRVFFYCFLALTIFCLDRFSKYYALSHWMNELVVSPYLSFHVTFNRGISWGLLNNSHTGTFVSVTLVIVAVTAALMWYALSDIDAENL